MPTLMPGAEPFFVRGGPVGLLLLHGFTASPSEMRPLAEALRSEGYTLLGARLPFHGTQAADMNRARWEDWLAAALDNYLLLRDQCPKVFVAGLSMGGALAFLLAAEQPVAGLISLSTPSLPFHAQRSWAVRNVRWLSRAYPFSRKGEHRAPDQANPVPRTDYRVRPLLGVAEFFDVVRAAALALPRVTAPALLVHSRADDLIPPASLDYIAGHIGSAEKELLWLETSGHVGTEDPARFQVFERVRNFLRRWA